MGGRREGCFDDGCAECEVVGLNCCLEGFVGYVGVNGGIGFVWRGRGVDHAAAGALRDGLASVELKDVGEALRFPEEALEVYVLLQYCGGEEDEGMSSDFFGSTADVGEQ